MALKLSQRVFNSALFSQRRHRYTASYEQVLGTSLEFQAIARNENTGTLSEVALLAEIDRLEVIFNAYNPASELRRWQDSSAQDANVSPELAELLEKSEEWRRQTQGAFNPAVEACTRLWEQAQANRQPVDQVLLKNTVGQLQRPLWKVNSRARSIRRLTFLSITLNSIAKGYIVDQAGMQAANVEGVEEVVLSIGGDIRHIGHKPLTVAIADPFADAENAVPVASVAILNQGLATSGSYRRGFEINGKQWSHVLDPRTGWPVENAVSVSVIAPNTLKADVLATAFSVLTLSESIHLANTWPDVGVFIVTAGGKRLANDYWKQRETERSAK